MFIELTPQFMNNGDKFSYSVNHIISFSPSGSGTMILFSDDKATITAKEPYEQVKQLIKEAQNG